MSLFQKTLQEGTRPVRLLDSVQILPGELEVSVAANTHAKPLRTLSHDLLETEKVVILSKYAQAAVGPIEHMINISAQCYPFWSRHRSDSTYGMNNGKPKKYRTLLIPDTFNSLLIPPEFVNLYTLLYQYNSVCRGKSNKPALACGRAVFTIFQKMKKTKIGVYIWGLANAFIIEGRINERTWPRDK